MYMYLQNTCIHNSDFSSDFDTCDTHFKKNVIDCLQSFTNEGSIPVFPADVFPSVIVLKFNLA